MEDQLHFSIHIPKHFKVSQIIKRDGRVVSFNPEKITNAIYKAAVGVGGSNRELAVSLTEKTLKMMNQIYPAGSTPTVEEIQDIIEKALIENGHAKTAKAFILYRAERARIREKKESQIIAEDNIPYKLVWKAYSWNVDHECDTIEKLNRQLKDGRWKKLVLDSEKHYHDEVKKVAKSILKKKDQVRLMIVAGPSSSGKTTTTIKIGECLKEQGFSFVLLNLDNYFKNIEFHPKDEYGDYDFEAPEALELDLINEHLSLLLKGKTIKTPSYDFKSGIRTDNVKEFRLNPGEIILIDSLHGLYEAMTQSVPAEQKFRFYIEAMCQIKDNLGEFVRWADLRMMRRMIRDSWHRGYDPNKTVGHWHYVRRSEKKYIVPFIHTADYLFNGSCSYEIPVYKNFLDRSFPSILKKYEGDPKKTDAYIRAKRVSSLLDSVEPFPDANFIPLNSFLREFIGGSVYSY